MPHEKYAQFFLNNVPSELQTNCFMKHKNCKMYMGKFEFNKIVKTDTVCYPLADPFPSKGFLMKNLVICLQIFYWHPSKQF